MAETEVRPNDRSYKPGVGGFTNMTKLSVKSIALMAVILTTCACARQVRVTESMTWRCEAEPDGYRQPGAQLVRFQYVDNPRYYFYTSGLRLCDQLNASGKKVVSLGMSLLGDSWHGMTGFQDISVDGKPVVYVGGWGAGGSTTGRVGEPIGPDPLQEAFKRR